MTPQVKKANYYVIRIDPSSLKVVAMGFKSVYEMESFISGSSNPGGCIPVKRMHLNLIAKVKKR
ncbi:MAG: hypothetical protein U9R75_11305 [Candidatus Thermoplasmatota archaeon]|nr:hypothetical protein [Candidatus Thermoplasmatota archaeon]